MVAAVRRRDADGGSLHRFETSSRRPPDRSFGTAEPERSGPKANRMRAAPVADAISHPPSSGEGAEFPAAVASAATIPGPRAGRPN